MRSSRDNSGNSGMIPACAGIGLRAEHYQSIQDCWPDIGWVEVHSENYFGAGGWPLKQLEKIRAKYPLSLHGVGLSLGSTDPLNKFHMDKLKQLIARFEPDFVSDHLSWSSIGGHYFNDLLPLPYTEEALNHVAGRVSEVQDILGRQLLIENPSSYLDYTISHIPEAEFISTIARATGCGILLDVNNIYVSAQNHGFDVEHYLNAISADLVKEIHLAGFTVNTFDGGTILIDTHNQRVAEPVWRLYRLVLQRFGSRPTLIEWDTDLPELSVLLDEAQHAQQLLDNGDAESS